MINGNSRQMSEIQEKLVYLLLESKALLIIY
jgi:hypothetical protein